MAIRYGSEGGSIGREEPRAVVRTVVVVRYVVNCAVIYLHSCKKFRCAEGDLKATVMSHW